MTANKINPEDLQPGQWFLAESAVRDMFTGPRQVTKTAGRRVYFQSFEPGSQGLDRKPTKTGYCNVTSIVRLIDSEKFGHWAWEQQWIHARARDAAYAKANDEFREQIANLFKDKP